MWNISTRTLRIINAILLTLLIHFCAIEIYLDLDHGIYEKFNKTFLIFSSAVTTLLMICVSFYGYFVLFTNNAQKLRLLAFLLVIFVIAKTIIAIIYWILIDDSDRNLALWLHLTIIWAIICFIGVVVQIRKPIRQQTISI